MGQPRRGHRHPSRVRCLVLPHAAHSLTARSHCSDGLTPFFRLLMGSSDGSRVLLHCIVGPKVCSLSRPLIMLTSTEPFIISSPACVFITDESHGADSSTHLSLLVRGSFFRGRPRGNARYLPLFLSCAFSHPPNISQAFDFLNHPTAPFLSADGCASALTSPLVFSVRCCCGCLMRRRTRSSVRSPLRARHRVIAVPSAAHSR